MPRSSSEKRRRSGGRSGRPAASTQPPVVAVALAGPEPAMAARVPVEPERPLPATRHAIFFDVENTSRAEHLAHVLNRLTIDRRSERAELYAVGNWRVIGADAARLLARHGVQLIHSAPSTGVRDWSDLRIAVSAGVWLAGARPGDTLEIVTDDRAFDAVGDVAALLGVSFRRVSYRALAGAGTPEEAARPSDAEPARRGRRRRRGRPEPPVAAPREAPTPLAPAPAPAPEAAAAGVAEPHTASHAEIIEVVRELASRAPGGAVLLDTLANELKARGFRRPPGSPRLITRLRRMKELSVSPTGWITLVDDGQRPGAPAAPAAVEIREPGERPAPAQPPEAVGPEPAPSTPEIRAEPAAASTARRRRRRRRRRGPRAEHPQPASA